jgi:hypothetical protein
MEGTSGTTPPARQKHPSNFWIDLFCNLGHLQLGIGPNLVHFVSPTILTLHPSLIIFLQENQAID